MQQLWSKRVKLCNEILNGWKQLIKNQDGRPEPILTLSIKKLGWIT